MKAQTIKVFKSDFGSEYYVLNGIAYDIHFPLKWALTPRTIKTKARIGRDPHLCLNCLYYGSYRGVFIGYCADCAKVFKYKRGNGMIGRLVEQEGPDFDPKNSIWHTYMRKIDPSIIGDRYENLRAIPEYIYSEHQFGVFTYTTTNCYYVCELHSSEYPTPDVYPLYPYPVNEAIADSSYYESEDTSSFYDGDHEITDEEYQNLCLYSALKHTYHTTREPYTA